MDYLVGISLALGVSLGATFVGFDRDRAFYPVVLVVIASTYDLFAAMAGSVEALSLETVAFSVFVLAAVLGFKTNLWLVAGALAGHGVFDLIHSQLISNAGVPAWWPIFCFSYDVAAAFYLAWRLSGSTLVAQGGKA